MALREFEVLSIEEIDKIESPGWLIHEIVPACGLVQVFGREGEGKTFLTLDMGLRIAAGMPWLGNRATCAGKVVYVAGEGVPGVKKRIAAWRAQYGVERERLKNFWVVPESVQLGEEPHVQGVVESIERVTGSAQADLIVFDTQARCTAGIDENSAEEMGVVVASLDWLRLRTGATILLVHHSPYKAERGRGSSTVAGAIDTAIGIRKKDHILTLSCGKQKDWEEFEKFQVGLLPLGDSAVVVEMASAGFLVEEALTPEDHKFLEFLGQRGTSRCPDLLRESKIPKSTFYRSVAKLKQLKMIEDLGGNLIGISAPPARHLRLAKPV